MHSKFKAAALQFTPPIIVELIKRIRRKKGILFDGNYLSWKSALEKSSGYDAENILNKVLDSTLKVQSGEAIFERDSVLFDKIQYSWPALTGLLWAAARNNGNLNILDFGGALGSSYFQNRKFLSKLPQLRWNIVEQSHYVKAGQQHINNETIRFYESIEDCLKENKPNVIVLSGVLQYLELPDNFIKNLSYIGAQIMILDRTPTAPIATNRLVIQHVPKSIYTASYPMWVFSRKELLSTLAKNWRIIAHDKGNDGCFKTADNLDISFEFMILEANQ